MAAANFNVWGQIIKISHDDTAWKVCIFPWFLTVFIVFYLRFMRRGATLNPGRKNFPQQDMSGPGKDASASRSSTDDDYQVHAPMLRASVAQQPAVVTAPAAPTIDAAPALPECRPCTSILHQHPRRATNSSLSSVLSRSGSAAWSLRSQTCGAQTESGCWRGGCCPGVGGTAKTTWCALPGLPGKIAVGKSNMAGPAALAAAAGAGPPLLRQVVLLIHDYGQKIQKSLGSCVAVWPSQFVTPVCIPKWNDGP